MNEHNEWRELILRDFKFWLGIHNAYLQQVLVL